MTSFTNTTTNYPQNANTPIKRVQNNRDPTSNDYRNFISGDEWLNKSTNQWFKLATIGNKSAVWQQLGQAATGPMEELTTTFDDVVVLPANGNINIASGLGIQATGSGNTITIANVADSVKSIITDLGGPVVPVNGVIYCQAFAESNIGGPLKTFGAGSQLIIQSQYSKTGTAPATVDTGVCSFDSSQFSVTNGFVSLVNTPVSGITQITIPGSTVITPIAGNVDFDSTSPLILTGGANQIHFSLNNSSQATVTTTDDTPTTIKTYNMAISSKTYAVEMFISAFDQTTIASATFKALICAKFQTPSTGTLVGTPIIQQVSDTGLPDIYVDFSVAGPILTIKVTGQPGRTIVWDGTFTTQLSP